MEKILQLLDALAVESANGIPIVVEGQHDISALRKLDITGEIITAKSSGKSLLDVLREVEERGKREVILLMDFDRRGKEWTRRLTQHLERMKIKPQLHFWSQLLHLAGRDIKDIEGLASYLETLRKKSGE